MSKQTNIEEKRTQIRDLIQMETAKSRYADSNITSSDKRSMRDVQSKRKKIKRELDLATREESRFSIWLKVTFGSGFLILAFFAIPISVGLLVMLATIPEVLQDINILPTTLAIVAAISTVLLFVQSGLISTILIFVLQMKSLRSSTVITFVVSLISIMVVLSFLAPVFRFRGIY